MKVIKMVFAASIIAAIAAILYGAYFYYLPMDPTAANQKIIFELNRGAHPMQISSSLEKLGLVSNRYAFYLAGKLTKGFGLIKAADYELSAAISPQQIFKILKSGIGVHQELLVREGENIYQVAATFESMGLGSKDQVVKLLKNREIIKMFSLGSEGNRTEMRSLEGYLYPNTYYFEKKDQAVTLIKRMTDAFLKSWTPEYEARAQELGLSRYQVVTLASMIEKETGAKFERPIISSVFHNRLKKRMRLQSDPTTIYGMWDRYTGIIRKADLLAPTEYNTYTVSALPVGPIANPSPEAVRAALYPAESEFLYFVSKNDGSHIFSKNYDDHRAGVTKFQINQKTR